MNPAVVISALIVLVYFGSMVARGRAIRGFGLPSGSEFLLIGILVGPKFMGLVSPRGFEPFEPLILFSLSWVSMIIGAHYGFVGDRVVSKSRMVAGIALCLLSFAPTAGAAFGLGRWLLPDYSSREIAILALAAGAVSCETTRHAVRWVTERYRAEGPLSDVLGELAEADDAVPLIAIAVAFALIPQADSVSLPLPFWALVLATIGTGAALGATAAALFDVEPRPSQRWGIMLGAVLLTAGAASRLGQSSVAACFVLGLVTSALCKHRGVLFAMLSQTERAVMLPVLVFAGVYVSVPNEHGAIWLIAGVFAVRVLSKLASGVALSRSFPEFAGTSGALGLGFMPAGLLTLTVGLACALRFRGPIGEMVLALAAVSTVLGELVGPAMLHRALRQAGEIQVASTMTPVPVRARAARLPLEVLWRRRRSQASRPSIPDEHELKDR